MTPEQVPRRNRRPASPDWVGSSIADEMEITAAWGVAVRRVPAQDRPAAYLLYADAKALDTIEAKPEGHTLTGVEPQSSKYSAGLPPGLPHFHLPLPFSYKLDRDGHAVHQSARPARPRPVKFSRSIGPKS